jgi:hypothetical protein
MTAGTGASGPAFETVDLSDVSNLDWDAFHDRAAGVPDIPAGELSFRGIPFVFGSKDGGVRLVALGDGMDADHVRIPLGRRANHVVFAHCLRGHDESLEPGDACATYQFVLEGGGDDETVPIRIGMEIGAPDAPWGLHPRLARSDRKEALLPRFEGRWIEAGYRQTEVVGTQPADRFSLWAWTNPHPDRDIEAIVVRAAGPAFAIAAITLGHLDEPVFYRTAKRPVRIELPEPGDAEQPLALEVEVDRGVATYPFALPAQSADAFLDDDLPGFGEPRNHSSNPAYVEIAASPSATVTVRRGTDVLGSFPFSDLETNEKLEPTSRLRVELSDPGRNWVRTAVVDDQTGEPIPCRIHFRSPAGIPFQPHGHHSHIVSDLAPWNVDVGGDLQLGHVSYAYIDGRCEGWLPRGDVLVDVARGFEYRPLRQRVRIEPGQQELTLRLTRSVDMAAEGFYSGDTHVHFLSTRGAHLEAAAEGLNVVNLLQAQWGHLFTSTEEFNGEPSIDDRGPTVVYVGQENRQHTLGHLGLLGLKRPIMPWSSDGPSEAELGGNLETTLSRWADACHEQGGMVVIPHFPSPYSEAPALILTGRSDAVEWLVQDPRGHREYYRYLNLGYRLPIAGGTDKMGSDTAIGLCRTYVRIPEGEPFSYESWCSGLKAGRTFMTTGPLLDLQVEGASPGGDVRLPEGGGTLEVHARVRSIFPVDSLEIVLNGRVVAATERGSGEHTLEIHESIAVDRHAWIAARCGGPGYFGGRRHVDAWERQIFAHTSPVYVAVGGSWEMFDPDQAKAPLAIMHAAVRYIREHSPQWPSDRVTHHHGNDDHLAYLEEPFRGAIEGLEERLRRGR